MNASSCHVIARRSSKQAFDRASVELAGRKKITNENLNNHGDDDID